MYASLGVEVCPTKTTTRGKERRRANLVEFWKVDIYNDEEPTVHFKKVNGFCEHEKISICYMLIPYTVEARAGIELLLGGGDGAIM